MNKILLCLVLLLPAAHGFAGDPLPRGVQTFIDRREGCDHMRGELPDPSEKERMKEVNHAIQRLCRGTDRDLARLKKQYASDPSITARLNAFETSIEPPPAPPPGRYTRR